MLGRLERPRALIAELRVLRHAMVRHPSAFLQHAFAHFLSLGHHETHARRVNQALQARMQALGEALRRELPDFQFELPTGGASVWVRAPDWVDTVNRLYEAPSQYLDVKLTAVRPRTKELVTLALVRLAALDPDAAAEQADKLRWRTWLRDETGGSVYLRLSTNPLEQPPARGGAAFRQGVIDGGYCIF